MKRRSWRDACDVCGSRPVAMTLHIETVWACPEHTWCADCAYPHLSRVCPRDGERVRDLAAAEAAVEDLRKDLARLGIVLPSVPLELVPSFPGNQLGEAVSEVFGSGRRRPRSVRILSGLGPTRFRLVAAHELTHCLLQCEGAVGLDRAVEEGVCELVAVVWLCSTKRPDAERHRRQAWRNAHPLYGQAMRAAVTAARAHGVSTVLDHVIKKGRLP